MESKTEQLTYDEVQEYLKLNDKKKAEKLLKIHASLYESAVKLDRLREILDKSFKGHIGNDLSKEQLDIIKDIESNLHEIRNTYLLIHANFMTKLRMAPLEQITFQRDLLYGNHTFSKKQWVENLYKITRDITSEIRLKNVEITLLLEKLNDFSYQKGQDFTNDNFVFLKEYFSLQTQRTNSSLISALNATSNKQY